MAELVTTRLGATGKAAAYSAMRKPPRQAVGLGGASVISMGFSIGFSVGLELSVFAVGLGLTGRGRGLGLGVKSMLVESLLATVTVETGGALVLSIATIATSVGNLGVSSEPASSSYRSCAACTAASASLSAMGRLRDVVVARQFTTREEELLVFELLLGPGRVGPRQWRWRRRGCPVFFCLAASALFLASACDAVSQSAPKLLSYPGRAPSSR